MVYFGGGATMWGRTLQASGSGHPRGQVLVYITSRGQRKANEERHILHSFLKGTHDKRGGPMTMRSTQAPPFLKRTTWVSIFPAGCRDPSDFNPPFGWRISVPLMWKDAGDGGHTAQGRLSLISHPPHSPRSPSAGMWQIFPTSLTTA